jgi:hypothetical protein
MLISNPGAMKDNHERPGKRAPAQLDWGSTIRKGSQVQRGAQTHASEKVYRDEKAGTSKWENWYQRQSEYEGRKPEGDGQEQKGTNAHCQWQVHFPIDEKKAPSSIVGRKWP